MVTGAGSDGEASGSRRGSGSFGVVVRGDVLRRHMRLRGLTGSDLARMSGLSDATISHALAGRHLHPSSFRKIVAHLARVDVIPGAEDLAAHDEP
jgi:transcriptional regulator with XRE-family HTH domain